MGETEGEIRQAMGDLREASVDILYARAVPASVEAAHSSCPVGNPSEFEEWKAIGEGGSTASATSSPAPLVRSSYHAKEQAREVEAGGCRTDHRGSGG